MTGVICVFASTTLKAHVTGTCDLILRKKILTKYQFQVLVL